MTMKSNNNIYTIKKYCHFIFCTLVMLSAIFVSCEDDSDMDLSLAVNSNGLKLPATGGSTHIMVYSTGEWKAEFLQPVDWASINKVEEKGNSSIFFTYSQNFGAARKVIINLMKENETEQIAVVQEGVTPTLKFPVTKYTVPKTSLPHRFNLTSNLKHNLDSIKVNILYDDETSEDWVSNIEIAEESFSFYALENNLGETRSARVTLSFTDGLDKEYSTFVDITQSMEEATIEQQTNETNFTKFEAQGSVTLAGNMLTSLSFFQPNIVYTKGSGDWIENLNIGGVTFTYDVANNESGTDRSAKIQLTLEAKNKTFTIEHTINQFATAYNIYSISQLKALISGTSGQLVITDAMAAVSGIIISEKGNPNMESNPNTTFNKIDFTENEKTAYMQSTDGSTGLRIKTLTTGDNVFARYSKATVMLSGLTLVKESNPERYTLKDLGASNILEIEPGSASNIVQKEKYIGNLTDNDIYTFVTLKDVEFSLPYGGYMNVNTGYTVKSNWNTQGITDGGYVDAVPTSFRDNKGGSMRLLINALVPWNRNLLPKGSGTMSGIIVNDKLIRYGINDGNIGRYSLRVIEESDIKLTSSAKAATLVEWNWIKNGTDISGIGTVSKDGDGNVLPAIGSGKLYCTGSTTTGLGAQPIYFADAASKEVINSAMHYAAKWWNTTKNEGEAFVFNFSTSGISGNNFTINFTQGAGSGSAATLGFPTYWQVEYSTDGTSYTTLPNSTYCVRPLGWWGGTLLFVTQGLTDHTFSLPTSLLGKTSVYVRLKPKSNVCTTSTGAENGTLDSSSSAVNVRVGFVSFKYSN